MPIFGNIRPRISVVGRNAMRGPRVFGKESLPNIRTAVELNVELDNMPWKCGYQKEMANEKEVNTISITI